MHRRARKSTANIGLVSPNGEMVCSSRGLTLHLSVGVDVVEKQQPPIPASREVPSVFEYKSGAAAIRTYKYSHIVCSHINRGRLLFAQLRIRISVFAYKVLARLKGSD
jgi:hypothetical protein